MRDISSSLNFTNIPEYVIKTIFFHSNLLIKEDSFIVYFSPASKKMVETM